MQYICTIYGSDGKPAPLSGLSDGPPTVESGKFSNMVFATDSNGMLYALDPTYSDSKDTKVINKTGALQPIFLNGAASVQVANTGTAMTGLAGVSFSNVDYNLWHETAMRGGNAGHGIGSTPDDSRGAGTGDTAGGDSMYFGLDSSKTYNVAGSAHGSLISSTFSLAAYTSADCPTLYFNYYMDAGGPAGFDSARSSSPTTTPTGPK